MIKSLEIKGFENHKNSKLEFSDKINLIIGSTNTGKSSIVKSIKWLVNNTPIGDEIINHSLSSCSVKAEFQNNIIEKIKNKNENKYIIDEKKELEAIGKKVPEEVKDIIKFADLNIQGQFDKFFLLQDTPGEVARKLNEIINLQIMDDCIRKIKSKVNKKNQDIKYLQEEIEELKIEIKKYNWIEDANIFLKEIEKKEEKVKILEADIAKLINYKEEILKYNKELKIINKKLLYKELFNEVKNKFIKYKEKNLFYEKLKKLKNDITKYKEELKEYKNFEQKKEIITQVNKIYKNYKKVNQEVKLLEDIFLYKSEISKFNNKIKELKEKKEKLLPKGSICPLCKQKIKE